MSLEGSQKSGDKDACIERALENRLQKILPALTDAAREDYMRFLPEGLDSAMAHQYAFTLRVKESLKGSELEHVLDQQLATMRNWLELNLHEQENSVPHLSTQKLTIQQWFVNALSLLGRRSQL